SSPPCATAASADARSGCVVRATNRTTTPTSTTGRRGWSPATWSRPAPCWERSATPATRAPRHHTCTTASTAPAARPIRCRACLPPRLHHRRPEGVERSIVATGLVPAGRRAYLGRTHLQDPRHGFVSPPLPHHRYPG